MSNTAFLELNDDVGVTADGNLEPLHEIGLAIAVPTVLDGEVVEVPQRITITAADQLSDGDAARFIAGTRIVEVADLRVRDALLQSGLCHETDAPSKRQVAKQKDTTTDAAREAGTHEED